MQNVEGKGGGGDARKNLDVKAEKEGFPSIPPRVYTRTKQSDEENQRE